MLRQNKLLRFGSAISWSTFETDAQVREVRISPRCYRDGIVCGFYSGCAAGFMFGLCLMALVLINAKW